MSDNFFDHKGINKLFDKQVEKNRNETLTLDDFIKGMLPKFAACRIAENIMRENVLADALFMDMKPATRWERFKWRYLYRIRDAWLVLIGKRNVE